MKTKLEQNLLVSTLSVMILFIAGSYLHLFEQLAWYDEILHFLSGAWGAIILIWLYSQYKTKVPLYKQYNNNPITFIVLAMLVVGIGWEVFEFLVVQYFEYAYDHSVGLQPSNFDTFTDLIADMVGAYCAVKKLKD